MKYLLLLALAGCVVLADDCMSCVKGGKQWCGDQGSNAACNTIVGCKNVIKNPMNCPTYPTAQNMYSDDFTRNYVYNFVGAVYQKFRPLDEFRLSSAACLKNTVPTATFYKDIHVQCGNDNQTCTVLTAYDTTKQLIIVAFAGTNSPIELAEEFDGFLHGKTNFFGVGNVFTFFYRAFYSLWGGGLEATLRNLMYLYPNYKIVSTGHSLGAALGTIFASHIAKTSMFTPDNIQLVTFGQPRTGDKNFSMWHDATFPYSYHVTHAADIVPHLPPLGGPDEVFHHRYEIWYNNDMWVGAPHTLCAEADGPYCSNSLNETAFTGLNWNDHVTYFNRSMFVWVTSECTKLHK